MSHRIRPPRRSRLTLLFAGLAMLLAACGTSGTSISDVGVSNAVISPLLSGFDAEQMTQYEKWFRGDAATASPIAGIAEFKSGANPAIDPACGLEYDYERMRSQTGPWKWTDTDGLRIDKVLADRTGGFYNADIQQVLFALRGRGFAKGGRSDCANAPYRWIPARLNLATGRWQFDGYASPGATITISVASAFEMARTSSDGVLEDNSALIISPFRLSRFEVTEENLRRVTEYALVSKDNPDPYRKISWFRVSDLSPGFTHQASGPVTPSTPCLAAIAFWGKDANSGDAWQCANRVPTSAALDYDLPTSMYLDPYAQMKVIKDKDEDDNTGTFGSGAGDLDYEKVVAALKVLATTAIPQNNKSLLSPAVLALRSKAFADLAGYYAKAQAGGLPRAVERNGPPADLGGWDEQPTDTFGVIAAHGSAAWDASRTAAKMVGIAPLSNFFGEYTGTNANAVGTVTITPSFSYEYVSAGTTANDFYAANSYLFGDSAAKGFNLMAFSTDDATKTVDFKGEDAINKDSGIPGVPYRQSPLVNIAITVTNALDQANSATYKSTWLPVYATYESGPNLSIRRSYNPIFEMDRYMSQALNDWMYSMYAGGIGSAGRSLSEAAVGTLLAVPNLDPFKISYHRLDGRPVYAPQADLDKDKAAACATFSQVTSAGNIDPLAETTYGSPYFGNKKVVDISGQCLQRAGYYDLYVFFRGFAFFLIFALVIRYLVGMTLGERKGITPIGFAARIVIVVVLVMGMPVIISFLGRIVAEAMLLFNLIGTQASGEPYSHLWLFASYLKSPPRDASVIWLILIGPFALLGFAVIVVTNWLRIGVALMIAIASPLWVYSVLLDPKMGLFATGLRILLRLYLWPLISLFLLLAMFLLTRAMGVDASGGVDPLMALWSILVSIIVAIVPFILSKILLAPLGSKVKGLVNTAIERADERTEGRALEAAFTGESADDDGSLAERHKNWLSNRRGEDPTDDTVADPRTERKARRDDERALREIGPGTERDGDGDGDGEFMDGPSGFEVEVDRSPTVKSRRAIKVVPSGRTSLTSGPVDPHATTDPMDEYLIDKIGAGGAALEVTAQHTDKTEKVALALESRADEAAIARSKPNWKMGLLKGAATTIVGNPKSALRDGLGAIGSQMKQDGLLSTITGSGLIGGEWHDKMRLKEDDLNDKARDWMDSPAGRAFMVTTPMTALASLQAGSAIAGAKQFVAKRDAAAHLGQDLHVTARDSWQHAEGTRIGIEDDSKRMVATYETNLSDRLTAIRAGVGDTYYDHLEAAERGLSGARSGGDPLAIRVFEEQRNNLLDGIAEQCNRRAEAIEEELSAISDPAEQLEFRRTYVPEQEAYRAAYEAQAALRSDGALLGGLADSIQRAEAEAVSRYVNFAAVRHTPSFVGGAAHVSAYEAQVDAARAGSERARADSLAHEIEGLRGQLASLGQAPQFASRVASLHSEIFEREGEHRQAQSLASVIERGRDLDAQRWSAVRPTMEHTAATLTTSIAKGQESIAGLRDARVQLAKDVRRRQVDAAVLVDFDRRLENAVEQVATDKVSLERFADLLSRPAA